MATSNNIDFTSASSVHNRHFTSELRRDSKWMLHNINKFANMVHDNDNQVSDDIFGHFTSYYKK
jgi:hypothetical protein